MRTLLPPVQTSYIATESLNSFYDCYHHYQEHMFAPLGGSFIWLLSPLLSCAQGYITI